MNMAGFAQKGGNFSLLGKPLMVETMVDLLVSMAPIWLALAFGLVIGWSWKPRWASFVVLGLSRSKRKFMWTPPGLGARRIWLAMTAVTAFQMLKELWSKFSAWKWPKSSTTVVESMVTSDEPSLCTVTGEDLRNFLLLLDGRDGGPQWQMMMDRSTSGMAYQAWRRDGEGPTQYKSRTVIEGITPQIMRDFFWDDEFRLQWDDMFISGQTLEECSTTGYMLVHWVRKFPFFCKDREYTIGRRIWEHGNTYYCLTLGTNTNKIPRKSSPRRVDTYYSCFRIRGVESRKDGSEMACEVMLFHSEDMGIQRDLAKLGIRQGMWGCVKTIEPGVHKYALQRKTAKPLSRPALMAQMTTKIPNEVLREVGMDSQEIQEQQQPKGAGKPNGNAWRWIIFGGAVVLACGVDRGAVGKVLLFGLAKRLGRLGGRKDGLRPGGGGGASGGAAAAAADER